MPETARLRLTERSLHLCIDMQRLFSDQGPWPTPWMLRVLPNCAALAEADPERTIFTRFVPPEVPAEAHGAWRQYYERWRHATRDSLDPRLIDLMPELTRFAPQRGSSTNRSILHLRADGWPRSSRSGASIRWLCPAPKPTSAFCRQSSALSTLGISLLSFAMLSVVPRMRGTTL
jgi:nicotinamidase-related amidase